MSETTTPAPFTLTREQFITLSMEASRVHLREFPNRELEEARLAVYCPEHGGFRDECKCPEPQGPDAPVRCSPEYVIITEPETRVS